MCPLRDYDLFPCFCPSKSYCGERNLSTAREPVHYGFRPENLEYKDKVLPPRENEALGKSRISRFSSSLQLKQSVERYSLACA